MGAIEQFIMPGETVLLKPNLFTIKGPGTGAFTDMSVVLGATHLLQENKNHCILARAPQVYVSVNGIVLNDFWFPKTSLDYPIINIPKLKHMH